MLEIQCSGTWGPCGWSLDWADLGEGSGSLGAAQAAQGKGLAAILQELLPTASWSLGWKEQEPWATEDSNEQSLGSVTVVCEGWPPWSMAKSKQKVGRRGELAGYSSGGTWQRGPEPTGGPAAQGLMAPPMAVELGESTGAQADAVRNGLRA